MTDLESWMAAVREEFDGLHRENEALRSENAELRARTAELSAATTDLRARLETRTQEAPAHTSADHGDPGTDRTDGGPRPVSRRGMIAAVAGAAGAAVIAQATPAAATDGSAVLAGRANSSNTETYVHSTAKVGLGATTSSSNNATAVYGLASAEAGTNNGVFGQAFGSSSIGVLGVADAGSGASYGVYGRSYSTSGVGVHGHSTAGSGEAIGVSGRTDSTGGTAVHGLAAASSGATIGVYGRSLSAAGFGVFCEGRLKATGRSYLRTPNSAPVDTDLDTGSVSMYLSQATNQLKIRVKFTTGVMRTATIPLA